MASYIESFAGKMDWAKPFQRTGKFPLDRTDLFSSYDDAVKYAAGNTADPDSRNLCGASYVGQIITVFENDVVSVYKIMADRTLSEVGTATEGDNKSIILSDGILSLFGFAGATDGQQPRVVNKGTEDEPDFQLEWYSPDTSTVEGLQQTVGQIQTTVGDSESGLVKDVADLAANKADKADTYTKTEIDGKLTGALHYQGTQESFQALTDAVTAGTITPVTGDVWNIQTAGGTDAHGKAIEAGDNVIYNGTGWDASSGTTDLSAYYTSTQIDEKLAEKVDKVEGSRLMTEDEGTKLESLTKVGASTTNGHIMIDDVDTKVYELPTGNADAIGGVKSSTEKDKIAIAADGTMDLNIVSGSKVEGAVAEASKTTNALTVGTKTFDGSAPVELTADDIPLPDAVVRKTDIASEEGVGVVKASAAQDSISVAADGTVTINDISASKVQGAVAEASKTTNALTAGIKTFDGSAPVEITAEDLGAMKSADMSSYVQKTDIATGDAVGVVKSSAAQDQVAIGADGVMTVNDISGSKVQGAVAEATNATKLGNVDATDILEGTDGKVKSAAAADKLAAAQDISLTGDANGTASFDGSAAASIAVTLKETGTAGTYTKVTTDAQGRVTAGEQLAATDIPDLTLAKITDAGTLAGKSAVSETDFDATLAGIFDGLESASHTHDNKATLDGITASKVSNWDDAASKIDLKANAADVYAKSDVYTKAETDGAIKTAVAGVYHFVGTYATLAELEAAVTDGTITPAAGDVYNIQTAGGTDMNGTAVKAGDNVAYVSKDGTTGWDILAGTMDLSGYATSQALTEGLATKAEKTVVDGINDRVGALETTVGDDTQGLVKSVADNTTNIGTLTTDVGTLKTTVGDAESGLVKAAADNTAAIGVLNGDENTEGSVKKLIAASATDINAAIENITKEGGTIDTKVAAHADATDAHADLFAAKQNKAIQTTITFEVADFVENTDGNGPAYKATKTIAELDAAKNYSPSVAPTVESCAVVAAAQFYPMAGVDAGALTLYCDKTPTAAIVVSGTFTEIQ